MKRMPSRSRLFEQRQLERSKSDLASKQRQFERKLAASRIGNAMLRFHARGPRVAPRAPRAASGRAPPAAPGSKRLGSLRGRSAGWRKLSTAVKVTTRAKAPPRRLGRPKGDTRSEADLAETSVSSTDLNDAWADLPELSVNRMSANLAGAVRGT